MKKKILLATNAVLCAVLKYGGLKFEATQYRWGRKLFKGKWYKIYPRGLSIATFWSDKEITSCQSEILMIEEW